MDEKLREELKDARDQAKDAARATLVALRSAIDFAINKLDDRDERQRDDTASAEARASAPVQSASGEPEGSMAAPRADAAAGDNGP